MNTFFSHKIFRIWCPALFILLLVLTSANGQKADYLIVEKPAALTIFNRFRQTLAPTEKNKMPRFSAFRIIENKITLNDQITEVSKVEWNHESFFLLLDSEGQIKNLDSAGFTRFFQNARVVDDTVQTLEGHTVQLSPIGESSARQALPAGTLVKRIFLWRERYLAQNLQSTSPPGWLNKSDRHKWEIRQRQLPAERSTLAQDLIDRLRLRVESANRSYLNFFSHFNKQGARHIAVPRWNFFKDENRLRFQFSDPALLERLPHSTAQLLSELNNMIIGLNWRAALTKSAIVIEPSAGG